MKDTFVDTTHYTPSAPNYVNSYCIKEGDRIFLLPSDSPNVRREDVDTFLKENFTDVKRVKDIKLATVIYGQVVPTQLNTATYDGVTYRSQSHCPAWKKYYSSRSQLNPVWRDLNSKTVYKYAYSKKEIDLYKSIKPEQILLRSVSKIQESLDLYLSSKLEEADPVIMEKLEKLIASSDEGVFELLKIVTENVNLLPYKTKLIEAFYMIGKDECRIDTAKREIKAWIKSKFQYDKRIYNLLDLRSNNGPYWSLYEWRNVKLLFPEVDLIKIVSKWLK